jgi:hypothetical protein
MALAESARSRSSIGACRSPEKIAISTAPATWIRTTARIVGRTSPSIAVSDSEPAVRALATWAKYQP